MATLTVNNIGFQDPLRSKPVRENFDDITSYVNNLQDQVDNITTAASGSEVVNARDYHTVLRDRIRASDLASTNTLQDTGYELGDTGGMSVDVFPGNATVNGVGVVLNSPVTPTFTAPTTNDRIDCIVLNSDATVSVLTGAESSNPIVPLTSSTTQLLIGLVYLKTTTTSISLGTESFQVRSTREAWTIQNIINSFTIDLTDFPQKNLNIVFNDSSNATLTLSNALDEGKKLRISNKNTGVVTLTGSISYD